MAERWLPVPGYEGLYEVSDQGRVRSLPRRTPHAGVRGGRIMRTRRTGRYRSVSLCRDGVPRQHSVHRLVLEAFVGPCPEGMEARHGPLGSGNDALENLNWGRHVDNMADKIRDGTAQRGERGGRAKLTAQAVQEIRDRAAMGEYHRLLAEEYGVARSTIAAVVCRQNWRHV